MSQFWIGESNYNLKEYLTAIENYLALQNLENESYAYSVVVEESIDTSLFKIPPMLIQPFAENAIEHAFVNQKAFCHKQILLLRGMVLKLDVNSEHVAQAQRYYKTL